MFQSKIINARIITVVRLAEGGDNLSDTQRKVLGVVDARINGLVILSALKSMRVGDTLQWKRAEGF